MTDSEGPAQPKLSHDDVAGLAASMATYCDQASMYLGDCLWNPASGSVMANESKREDGRRSYAFAASYVASGLDHLWALQYTLGPLQPPFWASFTLVRGCMEATARASWLLADDISSKQRVARGLCEHLANAKNADKVRHDPQKLAGTLASIQIEAKGNGITVQPPKGQMKGFDEERRPQATQVIEWQLQDCFGTGADHNWLFALLSGFAHSANFALIQGVELLDEDANSFRWAKPRPDVDSLSSAAQIASHLHMASLSRLGTLTGWLETPSFDIGLRSSQEGDFS